MSELDKFEMKIIKNKGIINFETKFGNEEISKLTISSNNKKGVKRYLKKFL